MPQTIRAVTFDVGGTLIEPRPSVGHIYADAAANFGGPPLDPELINRRFRAACSAHSGPLHSARDWAELVDHVFRDLVNPPPSQSFFPQLYERFSDAEAWLVHADVIPTLAALHGEGIRTAVLSNWDDRLRPLLRRLGLDPFFSSMTISCEVGAAKPDPGIFRAAASALNLEPQFILHVGDDPILDLEGARNSGLRALLIRRGQSSGVPDCIHSLLQIPDAIRSRSAPSANGLR